MTFTSPAGRCIALLAATLVVAAPGLVPAEAKSGRDQKRDQKRDDVGRSRPAGTPMLAVVSIGDQRITVYDAEGKILQSPVSSGQTGYETPAGIFSIVQKKEVHTSNLYQDGNMPFMQRITWTGIALHAGVLPGHPASHGCIRLPLAFAQQLFGLTDIGLRVVLVRDDIAPRDIDHPLLFKPSPARQEVALAAPQGDRPSSSDRGPAVRFGAASPAGDMSAIPGSPKHLQILKSFAAAKSAEADAAGKKAKDAAAVAARKAAEAAPATRTVRAAEASLARAEELQKAAERGLEAATASDKSTPEKIAQAEQAKEKAVARVAEARSQLETAKQQAQARTEAAAQAAAAAKAAETAREVATEAAEDATRKTSPVSVFVSRKTQRLYVRHGYKPVYESPVAIKDADKPIGSFVFTALGYRGNAADVRWNVVSMYKYSDKLEPVAQPPRRRGDPRGFDPIPADVDAAKAALDRIAIPQEALDRITEVVLPGSSLIVSDEGPSIETGKDTDFVVVMAGEPQGALKARKREPLRPRDDDYFFGGGKGGFFSFWN